MVPREVHVLTSGPCEYVTLHLTRDSADVSELRILRWDDPTSLTAQRWCFLHTHTHTRAHTPHSHSHPSLSLTHLTLTPHKHTHHTLTHIHTPQSLTHTPHTHTPHTHSHTQTHPSHTHPLPTHTFTHLHILTQTHAHTPHTYTYTLLHTHLTLILTHTPFPAEVAQVAPGTLESLPWAPPWPPTMTSDLQTCQETPGGRLAVTHLALTAAPGGGHC